jgi:hypothetical protein
MNPRYARKKSWQLVAASLLTQTFLPSAVITPMTFTPAMTFAAPMAPAPIMVFPEPASVVKISSAVEFPPAIKITSVKFPAFTEPASTVKIMLAEFSKSTIVVVEPRIAEKEPVAIMEAMAIPHAAEVIRPVIYRTHIVKVVPGAGADEHAIHKPLRPVVAVRRAAERIVGIEPPLANRWRVVHPVIRANVDP